MNKELIARQFSKAVTTYDEQAVAQRKIATQLLEHIIHFAPNKVARVLEVGCGTGMLSRGLLRTFPSSKLYLNDLCEGVSSSLADLLGESKVEFSDYDADGEDVKFPEELDLVASSSAVQWFEDLEGFLSRVAGALTEDGLLAISTFGVGNFKEIATLSGVSLPYRSVEELREMLTKSYDLLYLSCEELTTEFDSPRDVLNHLRLTGVNAVGSSRWTRGRLSKFMAEYTEKFSVGSKVTLTYNPIYIIAKKK